MRSPDIRERFLDFFAGRGHLRLPSASLVTYDDPSVLFTVAGMVPLKPYFLGSRTPPALRATSAQKCFRTPDIEEVGDPTHHTFFEMLGNFSFGDYFKEDAIRFAWELLTEGFGIDPARLAPSVHPGDLVAEQLWVDVAGVPRELVNHLDDNWWQAGPTGPCGYDSEIYFDGGAPCSCGRLDCRPQDECAGDRWTEIWNLVFMEFDQAEDGTRTPLPTPCIDTGMGLERIAAVLQGVRSNYDTDLFTPIVEGFWSRSADAQAHPASVNVLADHLRSAAFLIADGVSPGNEARGYALRRVIRRAAVHGRRVGLRDGLATGIADLVAVMGDAYPELAERREVIERTLRAEEEVFAETLANGVERLEGLLAGGQVAGADAFRLHDTFGFPIELTVELARERGADVDLEGFRAAMDEQRERSRSAVARVGFAAGPSLPASTFVGYETLEVDAAVVWVDADGTQVVVEPTPFYAEAGGQVGDQGTLSPSQGDGPSIAVVDSRFLAGGETRVLTLAAPQPWLRTGTQVRAVVDAGRRAQTARHHSATHLLNRALRDVLGESVAQRGSLVDWDHTTFDFSFPRQLTEPEIRDVERRVNDAIRSNQPRTVRTLPIAEAKRTGAVSMAGERYPDTVRVVAFGDYSLEFCGGTHVERTGDLGAAVIVGEQSVGTGVRRIEMLVGEAAERWWEEDSARLRDAARALRAAPAEVPDRVTALLAEVRRLRRELAAQLRLAASGGGLGGAVEDVGGVRLASSVVDLDRKGVLDAADGLFERLNGEGVAVVIGTDAVVVKVGRRASEDGVDARLVLGAVNAVAGGRGGGSAERVQGGIAEPGRRDEAVAAVRALLAGRGRDGNGSAH